MTKHYNPQVVPTWQLKLCNFAQLLTRFYIFEAMIFGYVLYEPMRNIPAALLQDSMEFYLV